MSYFVIKGPWDSGNYLCSMPEHATPQWYGKKDAIKFADAESAWKFMQLWLEKGQLRLGRIVRVNTVRDWQAERAQLWAYAEQLRLQRDLKEMLIKQMQSRLAAESESEGSKG